NRTISFLLCYRPHPSGLISIAVMRIGLIDPPIGSKRSEGFFAALATNRINARSSLVIRDGAGKRDNLGFTVLVRRGRCSPAMFGARALDNWAKWCRDESRHGRHECPRHNERVGTSSTSFPTAPAKRQATNTAAAPIDAVNHFAERAPRARLSSCATIRPSSPSLLGALP